MSKLTPEHNSRHPDSDSYSEVTAAYKYVDSVLSTADAQSPVNGLAWHGWALREAFLAGCTHAAEQLRTTRRPKPPSLKEQALAAQQRMWDGTSNHDDWNLIRRALEQLPDAHYSP